MHLQSPEPEQSTDHANALMESTIGLFKTELIKPQRPWKTLSQVELATAEWVDWYCHRRLHGEIGHVPPAEYET
ncbi:integrase core domain-containing protein, partial [Streptomyces pacificus]|uniref:integrase core domain-containing protein n=1 Tax=Streptomyces pacificus TaxID=2705029 RepID=UPI001C2056DD